MHTRTVENRKTGVSMARCFVQATFCLPPGPPDGVLFPQLACEPAAGGEGSDEGDAGSSSDHEDACAALLQCLHTAAEISDWPQPPDARLTATRTDPRDQVSLYTSLTSIYASARGGCSQAGCACALKPCSQQRSCNRVFSCRVWRASSAAQTARYRGSVRRMWPGGCMNLLTY